MVEKKGDFHDEKSLLLPEMLHIWDIVNGYNKNRHDLPLHPVQSTFIESLSSEILKMI